ncbi:hypothetical protein [Rhizobium lusitanum]|uniref:Chorismate-pyruvate lyase n=1 Tax=Rhizobium lusitanum TaxID=293958 RepID=A0A7X0IPX4_9HYPH|nr:hypothetical protein [Rhizobium lusitanum]MBB6484679.1 chorismate-pyruvate lyase [Rhizobium lusitanum]
MTFRASTLIRAITLTSVAGVALGAQPSMAQDLPAASQWPDTATARVEALAVLQTLNADLLSNASATLTLDRWCATHKLAPAGAKIVAQRVRGQDKPADAQIRETLAVKPDEPVAYRRVRLACGDRVLSEADNWYVPSRLTADMNEALNSSDVAFGRAVQSLNFTRTNLSAKLLWHPLPEGWEMATDFSASTTASLALPPLLLEHHAVLKLPDGTPFSTLVESYTRSVLDFPAPTLRQ